MNNKIIKLIVSEEGFSPVVYKCTAGANTIGHGINLDVGITEEESMLIVQHRLDKLIDTLLVKYDWFHRLNETRQAVIVSMVYQLGMSGFGKFKNMIRALEVGDYKTAAAESLDSRYARQTPNRANRQAKMLVNGL